jgi:hypothetical protein
MGLLESESELVPRTRTRTPAPVCVPPTTITPGVREVSRSPTFCTELRSTTSAAWIWETALPTSTRRCSPVAVTTTGFSAIVEARSVKLAVAVPPAATVTGWLLSP